MRAAIFHEPGWIAAGNRRDPGILEPTDAIVRVVLACACGSDLWYYRGDSPFEPGPIGHEFIGAIEEIGPDVRALARGDLAIAPFVFSDSTCPHCRHGVTTACARRVLLRRTATAARARRSARRSPPAARRRHAGRSSRLGPPGRDAAPLLTLSDVMSTGHHAAVCANVKAGDTVAVVGDGAVGLCAVLCRHAPGGRAESVGTDQSMATAIGIARPGSMVGYVGVPHRVGLPIEAMFRRTVGVRGGGAPARVYIPELIGDVLGGRINPGRVLDFETDLDGIGEAYAAMDERRAIKSLVRVGSI